MDKEENIRIQMRHFKMENVRLHGEVSRLSRYVSFLEEENRAIETEVRSECQATMDLLRYRIEVAEAKSEALGRKAESESRRADVAEALASERERRIIELEEEVNRFKGLREVADAAKEGNMDYRDVLEVIKRRTFLRNSDAKTGDVSYKIEYIQAVLSMEKRLVAMRVEDIIKLINLLFYIERVFQDEDDTSLEARLAYRKRWSKRIVGRIMHNNAIERCFRHIAIGRRNWLHTGSHESAQNIAFMFGLYESCKLNNLDFGLTSRIF